MCKGAGKTCKVMTQLQQLAQHVKLMQLNGLLAYAYTVALIEFKRRHPAGPRPMLDTTYRTPEEQRRLYEQGRTTPGRIVTYSRAGKSKHNNFPASAFDIKMVYEDGTVGWEPELFEDFDVCMNLTGVKYVWGATFKKLQDYPHWEI